MESVKKTTCSMAFCYHFLLFQTLGTKSKVLACTLRGKIIKIASTWEWEHIRDMNSSQGEVRPLDYTDQQLLPSIFKLKFHWSSVLSNLLNSLLYTKIFLNFKT